MANDVAEFLAGLQARYPAEVEFHQAVTEVAKSVWPFIEQNPRYAQGKILERLVEPERVIMFRVTWLDRHGEVQVNRGYRVQMSSAIGPDTDVPAGDIGVGGREIGFLFGHYKKLRDEVEKRLSEIMRAIHNQCVRHGQQDGFVNYVHGANIADFHKVAEAMLEQGLV